MNNLLPYVRRTGICLNMIVKNETPVLERLFCSVRSVIDYYVIVDTGSDDGTPSFIEEWMVQAGIPGEVHHRNWVNFGVNRHEALQLAVDAKKADWLLLIDADEELACSSTDFLNQLEPGVTYLMEKHHGGLRYSLPNLIDIRQNKWQWCAPVHEYLAHRDGPNVRQPLAQAWIVYHSGEGARSRGKTPEQKYLGDAALLEQQLVIDPADARSRFYLANSYRDAGHWQKARENYLLRAAMKHGWDEEAFCAQYQAGRMSRLLNLPHETVLVDLLAAFNLRPSRAEPLYELAAHCRISKRWGEALAFALAGGQLRKPADRLFVEHHVYSWKLLDELSVAAYWTGHFAISYEASQTILRRCEHEGLALSQQHVDRVKKNLHFAKSKIG